MTLRVGLVNVVNVAYCFLRALLLYSECAEECIVNCDVKKTYAFNCDHIKL